MSFFPHIDVYMYIVFMHFIVVIVVALYMFYLCSSYSHRL